MTSEEDRHRCEVRWCIRQGRVWFDAYKVDVAKIRGKRAALRLVADVKEQAGLGNAGELGDWRRGHGTTEGRQIGGAGRP